jgi:hypothetical protein
MGGWLYKTFATDSRQPQIIFLILFGVGIAASVFMFIYNLAIRKK